MRKLINVTLIMLALLLTLSGCGQDGKVSNRKFEKYLNLYLEYYEEVLEDEYDDCYADIFFDADGNPLMCVLVSEENGDDIELSSFIYGVSGREVKELKEISDMEYATDFPMFYTDGFVRIGNEEKNTRDWYQIKDNEFTKVASYKHKEEYNLEETIVTFYIDDERIKTNIQEDSIEHVDLYKRLCKEYYSGNKSVPAEEYVQTVWLENLLDNNKGFLHSPSLTYDYDIFMADFSDRINELLKIGSMSADEYLVWQHNYVIKEELYSFDEIYWDDEPWYGVPMLYHDAALLNQIEIELDLDNEENVSYLVEDFINQLVAYFRYTEDWSTLKKLDVITELEEDNCLEILRDLVTSIILDYYLDVSLPECEYARGRALELFEEQLKGTTNAEKFINTYEFIKTLPDKIPAFEEERAEMALELYKEAYAKFLSELPKEERPFSIRFDLAMINEDDIPELLVFSGTSNANGVDVYTYYNEEVHRVGSFGKAGYMDYLPKKNLICSDESGMATNAYSFYKINGGSCTKEYSIYYFDDIIVEGDEVYSINDVEVSEAEVLEAFEKWSTEHQNGWETMQYDNAMEKSPENIEKALGYELPQQQVENTTITNIDVEAEVKQIREWYNDTQSRLDSMLVTDYPNYKVYHDAGYPVKIVAARGYNDWDITREYYYHDQKLYFAFVYDSKGSEVRLYFKEGSLIRFISPDGTVTNTAESGIPDDWKKTTNYVTNEGGSFDMSFNCGN